MALSPKERAISSTAVWLNPPTSRQAKRKAGQDGSAGRAASVGAAALGRHVDGDDEDVLRYVIGWIKKNHGDGPHLVAEVASILWMLGLPAAETLDASGDGLKR